MAGAITVPQVQPVRPVLRFVGVIPGVLLLAAVGYAGKLLEQNVGPYTKARHWTFPNIEYVLWAIVLGLLISNTVGVPEIFRSGVATYEFWLRGASFCSVRSFCLAIFLGSVALASCLWPSKSPAPLPSWTYLGRAFKLKPKLKSLLAVGSAVCGVSAFIATKGAIDANDKDSSLSIAAILALGAFALFTFPLIGHFLHLKLAVLVKSTRNATIGIVVLAYAIYWAGKGQALAVGNKAAFLWQKFPKFVLDFLLISVLATYHFFSKDQVCALANLSRWAFLLTFAGVGLHTNFREMRKQGLRPFVVGAIGVVVIAAFTLALVIGAGKPFGG